jgi:hypothetical protein
LLALYRKFNASYRIAANLMQEHGRLRQEAEANPDYPAPGFEPQDYAKRMQFLADRGCGMESFVDWNAAISEAGDLAESVIRTPARTPAGVLAMLRIVRLCFGRGLSDDSNGADYNLRNRERWSKPWLPAIVRDLERLASGQT